MSHPEVTSSTSDIEKSASAGAGLGPTLAKIQTSDCGRYVRLGDQHFDREEFSKAMMPYGGDFRPGAYSAPQRKFGNPAPIGLASFSICLMTLSLINARARDVTNPAVLGGAVIFVAGLLEVLAGMWCLVVENTFAATVFSCFGGFWMGHGILLIQPSGLVASYATPLEYQNAIGMYLLIWTIFAFLCWILTFKSTWAFTTLFFTIWVFLLFLAIGGLTQSADWNRAGGIMGVVCATLGFYNMFAGMCDESNSYFTIKPYFMPGAASS